VIQVLGRTQLEKVELQKFISHLINLCRSLGMVIYHSMVTFFAFYIFFSAHLSILNDLTYAYT
jgi:hypothetical protein